MVFNWCIVTLYACAIWCLSFIIHLYGISNYFTDWACHEYDKVEKEYDYIIVGGGSSGAMLAHLMSESDNSILLLEAGIEASSYVFNIPVVAPLLQLSELDWQYKTESHSNACLGLQNNASRWPMGKLLGGTSRLNSLVYLRGHARDFDSWAENGCSGWSFQDVLPHFKALENQHKKTSEYDSTMGPVTVSNLEWTTPLVSAFLEAGKDLGYAVRDLNGPKNTGFMEAKVNLHKGLRWSPDQMINTKTNLHVATSCTVEKVLVKDGFEAYGVLYRKFDYARKVVARKGVILSAGVIGTPKILMLSGIGPAHHLKQHGISVIKDLPVGQNLQDHVTTGLDLVVLNLYLPMSLVSVASPMSFLNHVLHRKGPWTFPGCEGVAVVHTESLTNTTDAPDLQLMLVPIGISSDGGMHLRKALGISDKIWNEYFVLLEGQSVVSVLPVLLHPKSRGEVLLRSRYPNDAPIIKANYLSHPQDIQTLLRGIDFVKKLIKTEPMQKLGARLNEQPLPGCETHEFDSFPYWKCYLRHMTLTSFHPAGTCKMGDVSDTSAVVDSNLRVRGLHKLFVIDASVMPSLPSANIQASVLMIAHKGAELVQAHWKELHGTSNRKTWLKSLLRHHGPGICSFWYLTEMGRYRFNNAEVSKTVHVWGRDFKSPEVCTAVESTSKSVSYSLTTALWIDATHNTMQWNEERRSYLRLQF